MIVGWAKTHKRVGVFIIVVLILGGVGASFALKHVKATNKKNAEIAHMNDLMKQATPLIDPSKHIELSGIVEQLKQLNECNDSPDCLYVITKYYIGISDSSNSRIYYDKLATVFRNSKTATSKVFKVTSKTLTVLEASVKFLEKQTDFYKKSVIFSGNPSD